MSRKGTPREKLRGRLKRRTTIEATNGKPGGAETERGGNIYRGGTKLPYLKNLAGNVREEASGNTCSKPLGERG